MIIYKSCKTLAQLDTLSDQLPTSSANYGILFRLINFCRENKGGFQPLLHIQLI